MKKSLKDSNDRKDHKEDSIELKEYFNKDYHTSKSKLKMDKTNEMKTSDPLIKVRCDKELIMEFQESLRQRLSKFLKDCDDQCSDDTSSDMYRYRNHSDDDFDDKCEMLIENLRTNTPCSDIESCSSKNTILDNMVLYKCSNFNSNETLLSDHSVQMASCNQPLLIIPNCRKTDSYCNCFEKVKKIKQPKLCFETKCDTIEFNDSQCELDKQIIEDEEPKKTWQGNRIVDNKFIGKFITGSAYIGDWDIEMNGFGKYRYADGTEYHGNFLNGEFHGKGVILMPNKFRIEGNFKFGKLISHKIYYPDELEFISENWNYCKYPDRRYWAEVLGGILPVGDSFLTPTRQPIEIPKGCYDLLDSYLHEDTGFLLKAEEPHERIRYVVHNQQKWIIENCRKDKPPHVGVRPDITQQNEIAMNGSDFFSFLHKLEADPESFDEVETTSCSSEYSLTPMYNRKFPKL